MVRRLQAVTAEGLLSLGPGSTTHWSIGVKLGFNLTTEGIEFPSRRALVAWTSSYQARSCGCTSVRFAPRGWESPF